MATKTREIVVIPGKGFWRTRRDRVASALLALFLAVLLAFFVLGRGPGTLLWLSGERLSWLPFVGAGLTWLPAPLDWSGAARGAGESPATAAVKPSAARGAVARATQTPQLNGAGPASSGVAAAVAPSSTPATIASSPTATPTPTPGPGSTAISTPTPTPAPISTVTPAPTPTPFQPVQLYADNFQADLPLPLPPSGWTNEPPGLLGASGYTVVLDGSNVLKGPAGTSGFPVATAGSSSWTDYTVSADVKVDPANGHARLIARHQSAGNFYACGLDAGQQLFLGKEVGGSWSTFATDGYSFKATTWYHLDFSVQGGSLVCAVSEPGSGHSRTLTASAADFSTGSIGATGEYGAEYDNFVVTSLP